MGGTWILQTNPKLYNVDGALHSREVIYWRIPQFAGEVKAADRALIWRSGTAAGFVAWGRFLANPQHFDLSKDDDPFVTVKGIHQAETDLYAPVRVWPAGHVPKAEVAAKLPAHQIVTAPRGTVFRLDTDSLDALLPLLQVHGYKLDQPVDGVPPLLPVLPETHAEPKTATSGKAPTHAQITPAMFLLSSTPERPTEITIEGDALRLLLVERAALRTLDDSWDSVGIYLLVSKPTTDQGTLSVYVGKAQGLRSRVKTGHQLKEWTRCLLIQREGRHPFNASDISWLERRLIDVLLEAPDVDLINKTPPPIEVVPEYKSQILERTVIAALGVLGILGAYVT